MYQMKTEKLPDAFGLCAEHLKIARRTIILKSRDTYNGILRTRNITEYFSGGVLTPVPKSGKDPSRLDNFTVGLWLR